MKYKILIYNNAANNILQVFHKYQQKNILKNKKWQGTCIRITPIFFISPYLFVFVTKETVVKFIYNTIVYICF